MADVSLDDLIKKDREKGKLDRLKNVSPVLLRNSKAKNSSKEVNPLIIKSGVIEGLKMLLRTNTGLSKSALIILVMIVETTKKDKIPGTSDKIVPGLSLRKRKKDKRCSAH